MPAAPAYNPEEFKREMRAPVLQALKDSIDQLSDQLQSEEQSIADCLQQRIVLAQDQLQGKLDPQKAAQQTWDAFVLLRSEASLRLSNDAEKPATQSRAAV